MREGTVLQSRTRDKEGEVSNWRVARPAAEI